MCFSEEMSSKVITIPSLYIHYICGLILCVCVCQVFEFLIRLHSADSSEEEEVFPFIRTLLHFDTREFLNVLAMVRFLHTILTLVSV